MKIAKYADSYPVSLFVTGRGVLEACGNYCDEIGLCVTVTETTYVFKDGDEKGYIIGLINYPRFPKDEDELDGIALDLAEYLIKHCNPEGSFTMQTPYGTYFYSNRPED